jgi:hypothetical protein
MLTTTPIRLFLLFAALSLLGFACAAWTAGATVPVLAGVVGAFAAAVAVVTEIDRTPPPAATACVSARR